MNECMNVNACGNPLAEVKLTFVVLVVQHMQGSVAFLGSDFGVGGPLSKVLVGFGVWALFATAYACVSLFLGLHSQRCLPVPGPGN
jgi:hypothetical protein